MIALDRIDARIDALQRSVRERTYRLEAMLAELRQAREETAMPAVKPRRVPAPA